MPIIGSPYSIAGFRVWPAETRRPRQTQLCLTAENSIIVGQGLPRNSSKKPLFGLAFWFLIT